MSGGSCKAWRPRRRPKSNAGVRFGLCESYTAQGNKEGRKEAKNIIPLVSDANSDAGERRRHEKKVHDCKRLLDDTKDEELAEKGFGEENVRSESDFSVSGAVLYREDALVLLRRHIALSMSQGVFSSL